MGRTLGQGPQWPPDTSLSLGPLLTPQLLQRRRKKGTTKVKMRRRQWSAEAAPQMGSAGSIPAASPSPPYSPENQFTAPTSQSCESSGYCCTQRSASLTLHCKLRGTTGAGGGTSTPKSHLSRREGVAGEATGALPPPYCRFDSPQGPPPPWLGLLGALMAEEGVTGSPPVPSGAPVEEGGLSWTPRSPLGPDLGLVSWTLPSGFGGTTWAPRRAKPGTP